MSEVNDLVGHDDVKLDEKVPKIELENMDDHSTQ